jgi:hypothetical protein
MEPASREAAEISGELAVPPTDDPKGGLKVDFRMPDSTYVSDTSLEIKRLIAQMEEERKRWEDERKRFLEQTEGLLVGEEPYTGQDIPEPSIKKSPEIREALLSEMNIVGELDELRNELESWREMTEQLESLDENVDTLTNVLGEFSARTLEDISSLSKKLEVKADVGELGLLKELIDRLDGKLDDVIDVVGYEESLNLSKIPPKILELVYQTTLDDVTSALVRTHGEAETEKLVNMVMEEVRIRTSGSEMFRYQYPRFKIKGLASSIERGLVSAKQVQMTYDEILKRLKEQIPQHQAKNFRAMIKVKSQEFAVETSTDVSKRLESMEAEMQTLGKSVSEISSTMSQEISRLASELADINSKLKRFEPAVDGKKSDGVESTFEQPSPEVPQETVEGADEEPSAEEVEKQVLALIPVKGTTVTKLKKLDLPGGDLQSVLDSLVKKGAVYKRKKGKGFVYSVKEGDEEGGGSDNERK